MVEKYLTLSVAYPLSSPSISSWGPRTAVYSGGTRRTVEALVPRQSSVPLVPGGSSGSRDTVVPLLSLGAVKTIPSSCAGSSLDPLDAGAPFLAKFSGDSVFTWSTGLAVGPPVSPPAG